MKQKTRTRIYHTMSIAFIIAALCFSVFRFQTVFVRMLESIKDLALSFVYFFVDFFAPGLVTPTVTDIPEGAIALLPMTLEEFKACFVNFQAALFDKDNFFDYTFLVFQTTVNGSLTIITIAELLLVAVLIGWLVYGIPKKKKQKQKKKGKKPSKKTDKSKRKKKKHKKRREVQSGSTKPFAMFFRIQSFFAPFWNFFKCFKTEFLAKYRGYYLALILIWLYNLNVFTIVLEVLAYILYLGRSCNIFTVYTQAIKLLLDLSVSIFFLPLWVQAIIGYKIFHAIRCWFGKTKLCAYEKKIMERLSNTLGSIFINGKQRARKTTLLTVLAVVEEKRQHFMAKKGLKARSKQFPHFPWRKLEKTLRIKRKQHVCYTLASTREYIRGLRSIFEARHTYTKEQQRRILDEMKKGGYCGDNFIFGYKYNKFPLKYNDGVRIVNIYECIEHYARLYFIYNSKKPLVFGNYSIRSDGRMKTRGNFEKYEMDFFKRKPEDIKNYSQYSHYAILDSMRLGKLMDPFNPYKDAMEFGVVAMTEFEKEVGNQNTNSAYKVDSSACNRRNDGMSNFLKTCTHMATVDNQTFFRFMCDGHRPGSMAADYAELCTLWRIKKCSESKIVLPFFAIEGAICELIMKGYDWIEDKMSYLQGKRTLLMYLIDCFHGVIFRHYDRIKNRYSMYTTTIDMWDGADGEMIAKKAKLPIPEWLAFGDRFATDAWGEFFHEKAKRSKYGIDDIPQFKDKKMSFDEMQSIGSHIYNEMGELMRLEAFVKARQERDKLIRELEEKKKEEAKSK